MAAAGPMATAMDDARLLTLANWLSPAYPIGAFAYSHGLEQAIADGVVADRATLEDWLERCLIDGAGRNDALLLGAAWRAVAAGDPAALAAAAETATALCPSAERRFETLTQGDAFRRMVVAVHDLSLRWPEMVPYPVAVGAAAAALGHPRAPAAALFVQSFAANLISAALRLVPLGQTDGQRALARLQPAILEAAEASEQGLEDLGGCALLADIAAMRHETLPIRLFRT